MIKKILLGLMCVNLLMFSGSNALAETVIQENDDFIDARSVNTASMKLGFDISNAGTANITASVMGKAATSKIQLNVKLQKYNSAGNSWKKVKSWDKTAESSYVSLNTSYKLSTKGTYRCVLSASVWKNGNSENVSMVSDKKSY